MKIRYLGHSAVLIDTGTHVIAIDPFISGNPKCRINAKDIVKLDYILVTHGHADHIGDTVSLAKRLGSVVIANHELSNYFMSLGLENVHGMHIGGGYRFEFGYVKMTPALHGSSIDFDDGWQYAGSPCGFMVEAGGRRIYHAGDTGLTYDMKLLERYEIDLAMLPIGGNYTMDTFDASLAVDFIKPKKVMPIHYDTFEVINADMDQFMKLVGDKVALVAPGDEIEI